MQLASVGEGKGVPRTSGGCDEPGPASAEARPQNEQPSHQGDEALRRDVARSHAPAIVKASVPLGHQASGAWFHRIFLLIVPDHFQQDAGR